MKNSSSLQARMHLALLLLILISYGCTKDPVPVASFTLFPESPKVDETVNFTNTSENADSYEWTFGDGSTSQVSNPSHVYKSSGNFTVTLKVTGAGGSASITKSILVSYPSPEVSFTMSKAEGNAGEALSFVNTSKYCKSYTWNFGDGSASTEVNPSHAYTNPGTYTVTLTASGEGGSGSYSATLKIVIPVNIYPGVSAMNISLAETWQTVQSKLGTDYTQYGPILLTSGSSAYVIHPVESKSKGIYLYFLSMNSSFTFSSSDVVFLIVLKQNFIGQTAKGIKMGSQLTEVATAYGNPQVHNTTYYYYDYKSLGVTFYYDKTNSMVNQITISTASKKDNDIINALMN